ncbi:MAG: D-2-hydroxyacid dehydrogenase [Bacteroidales bacterium]|nr:D-2-hydroxyacid dehydrogenase [Bacteroidales bacterium]
MNIVFLDTLTIGEVPAISILGNLGNLKCYHTTSSDEVYERVKEAEVIITNKVIINAQVIDKAPALKLICIAATGMNNVDLEYAQKKRILVKNVSGYSTESVAQSTFTMLLYLIGSTAYYDDYVKSGEYSKGKIFTHHGRNFWQLAGKRYGIIGLGNIGKRVAEIARVFGCEVVYFSTSGKNKNSEYLQVGLHDLLSTSDIVSIHAPLNEKTKGLIGKEQLKKMKPGAYLINVGRGGIVDEEALMNALNDNLIAGAGVDVFTKEPIPHDNPLMRVENPEKIVFTPHTAWASVEARSLLIEKIYLNIEEFIKLSR